MIHIALILMIGIFVGFGIAWAIYEDSQRNMRKEIADLQMALEAQIKATTNAAKKKNFPPAA
jgi:hypothetical protein